MASRALTEPLFFVQITYIPNVCNKIDRVERIYIMSAVIEVKDVWKSFRVRGKLVEAVKGINMHIEAGEVFGFLGPNGAGKTTTLRLLTTLLTPDRGEVSVAGYHLKQQPASVRKHIGYVSQAGGSDVLASGRKNILLQGYACGLPRDIVQQRTNELIEALELTGCADRQVSTYSGGQRRRLDLALVLVLLMLSGLCIAACSYALALLVKNENGLSSILNTLTLPLFLLSGITLPLTLAPPLLRDLGNFNPLAYVVNAARALFLGNITGWVVGEGFLITGILAMLALIWVTRAFQQATT